MKEKTAIFCIHLILLALISIIFFVFGLLLHSPDIKIIYKEKIVMQKSKIPLANVSEKIIRKRVYIKKIGNQNLKKHSAKLTKLKSPIKLNCGISIVTCSFCNTESYAIGTGLNLRWEKYVGQIIIFSNRMVILSLGYEF